MKTVHKHVLTPHGATRDIEMTEDHTFVYSSFMTSAKEIWVWVECSTDPGAAKITRRLKVCRSGDAIPESAEHCGTAVDQYHAEAYHVYALEI